MTSASTPILLLGMMGAGKTTLGRLLAARLGRDFYDLDEEIERAAGKPVAGIFLADGEAAFRALEKKTLAGFLSRGSPVIAGGGGVMPQPGVLNVWLRADLEVLYRRSEKGPLRPRRGSYEDFKALYAKRKKGYQKAEIHVLNNAPGPETAVGEVLKALETI